MYEEYLAKLEEKLGEFLEEAKKGSSVKAAALKARKLSLFLGDELPNFRKLSVKNDRGEEITAEDAVLKAKER